MDFKNANELLTLCEEQNISISGSKNGTCS